MIVVSGNLELAGRQEDLAVRIAGCAAANGAPVEVIGVVADGPAGDRRMLTLANAKIGHSAVLRMPARALEPADIEMALRYLPDIRVIVATDSSPSLTVALSDGASYAGATLILVDTGDESRLPAKLAASAIVLRPPATDPDGTFASFVGAFAAQIDSGAVPAAAWAATVQDYAVDPVTPTRGRRDRLPGA